MTIEQAIDLLDNLIGMIEDNQNNDYDTAFRMAIEALKAQLSKEGTTSDLISKFIDGLEEIFADLRERHVDDSVCGLCEYDGAYIGQSGDWYNECPGFERDDCFKLSDKIRKEWTDEIIKALPTVQPERKKGKWIYNSPVTMKCDQCGLVIKDWDWHRFKFCPNCDCDMRGEQE